MDFEGFGKRLWADNPQREERLLTWLDEHPDEVKIMFSPSNGRRGRRRVGVLTKSRCFELAAHAVFADDEDPALREQLVKDPHYLALSTRNRVEGWKSKYQRVNSEIGATASNTPFEEIETGSKDRENIKEQLVYFPLWTRLHVHWRTLPNFNQFYSTKKPSPDEREEEEEEEDSPDVSSASAPPSKRRRKATKKAAEADRDESVDRQSSPDADSDVVEVVRRPQVEEDEVVAGKRPEIIQRKLNALKRKHVDDTPSASTSRANTSRDSTGLTATQKHERELAELALKLQALENEALEKKTAAELRRLELEAEERRRIAEHNNQRAKEKHELMMKMMSLAEGKTASELS